MHLSSLWDCANDVFQRWDKDSLESAGWVDIQPLEKEKEGSGSIVR